MAIELIVYGPHEVLANREVELNILADKCGLKRPVDGNTTPWAVSFAGGTALACVHKTMEGLLAGDYTPKNVQAFLIEAMKLPGVFLECPEHTKRKFWTEEEKFFRWAESGESRPISDLRGAEGRRIRLSTGQEGVFVGFEEGMSVVIRSEDYVLPFPVDERTTVVFL